jgi:hypothetical protein
MILRAEPGPLAGRLPSLGALRPFGLGFFSSMSGGAGVLDGLLLVAVLGHRVRPALIA